MHSHRRMAVALVPAWLIRLGPGVGGVAVTREWYEYHVVAAHEDHEPLINDAGWQPTTQLGPTWGLCVLRRPRVRVGLP